MLPEEFVILFYSYE